MPKCITASFQISLEFNVNVGYHYANRLFKNVPKRGINRQFESVKLVTASETAHRNIQTHRFEFV